MNKIKIGREEIEQLIIKCGWLVPNGTYNSFIHREEDYKEVFVLNSIIYVYDIYLKSWIYIESYNPLKEGFYNYNVLNSTYNVYKNLNKNKVYTLTKKFSMHKNIFVKYNKELEVWEEIFIKYNKYYKLIKMLSLFPYNIADLETVNREEFNKLILLCELVT